MSRWVYSLTWITLASLLSQSHAANQTPDFSPVLAADSLPYKITLQEYDFGVEELPTLHSFAAGQHDGKWVVFAGRTNGLHAFDANPFANFPPEFQNQEVWVIDPVSKMSWSRNLTGPTGGLNSHQLNSLTTANNQFYQRGEVLYMNGGYGYSADDPNGNPLNSTFNTLSAIDLPGIIDWTQNNTGQAIDHIRQLEDERLRVTGGAMVEMNGRSFLSFGQDYGVNYSPGVDGEYTHQIRNFEIVDDGNSLSIQNYDSSGDPNTNPNYRRRDLNVFPVVSSNGLGGTEQGITVLSGVFTESFGIWTHPVEIDESGNTTEVTTFKQGMNVYHSSKFGMFSESTEEMHQLLLGGLTIQSYDESAGAVSEDSRIPFTNQLAAIVIDPNGTYQQHYAGLFPELNDDEDNELRFGTNAEFFLAENIATYGNGVIKMDELADQTVLGYVYGGIVANAPHVRRDPLALSGASDRIFEVVFTRVPEPSTLVLTFLGILGGVRKATRLRTIA